MHIKFSEDVIPLSDLKVNLGKVVNHEKNEDKLEFLKAITQGLMDIKAGNTLELDEVKKRLDIS